MGRGSAWLDTGNTTNLFNASQYIAAIEESCLLYTSDAADE